MSRSALVAAGSLLLVALAALAVGGSPSRDSAASLDVLSARSTAPGGAMSLGGSAGRGAGGEALLEGPQQEFVRPPRDYRPPTLREPGGPREFYFTRAIYNGYGYRRMGSWSTDFPKADRQFLWGLARLTNIDLYEAENPIRLTDPELRRFPFLYALEVGYMSLSPEEIEALRDYLLAGGFLIIDDFWGTYEWQNFEHEIRRVLPEHEIVDMSLEHPIFSTFYDIREILQVPSIRYAWSGGPTWERDGYVPHVRGIFDERGRLLVLINWNTDLGDAWEWAEDPYYPLPLSTFAYQLAVNTIVYAMSH